MGVSTHGDDRNTPEASPCNAHCLSCLSCICCWWCSVSRPRMIKRTAQIRGKVVDQSGQAVADAVAGDFWRANGTGKDRDGKLLNLKVGQPGWLSPGGVGAAAAARGKSESGLTMADYRPSFRGEPSHFTWSFTIRHATRGKTKPPGRHGPGGSGTIPDCTAPFLFCLLPFFLLP